MPEGPEIRRAADRIAKVLVGQRIREAWFAFDDLKYWESELEGREVTSVDTRGKAMLTRFDNDLTIYSHNQLYGRWYTCKRDKPPATKRSLRLALHTDSHSALLYSASDVDVLTPANINEHPFLARVGPDILDKALKPNDVAARLAEKRFRNRGLGALYLDQHFLAGIGNYLRSEILFTAGVHPANKPSQLDEATMYELASETLKISRRAYRLRGVTVSPEMASAMKAEGQRFGQYRHWVFGRGGKPCRDCGEGIERMAVSSRGLFYCPACQPQRG